MTLICDLKDHPSILEDGLRIKNLYTSAMEKNAFLISKLKKAQTAEEKDHLEKEIARLGQSTQMEGSACWKRIIAYLKSLSLITHDYSSGEETLHLDKEQEKIYAIGVMEMMAQQIQFHEEAQALVNKMDTMVESEFKEFRNKVLH